MSALIATCVATSGCKRPGPASPATRTAHPTIASLVPSATDVLLSAGLGNHLVAVSTYCKANPQAVGYPSVGDYESTDWERLRGLRPDVMLVFMAQNRIPAGMRDRAAALGTRLVVVKVETVADVLASHVTLGDLTGEPAKAAAARDALRLRLEAVKARGLTRVPRRRVLMVVGGAADLVVGHGGFLDELLTMAGGENVAAGLTGGYPSVDRERLASLGAERIVHLLPGAGETQAAAARQMWASLVGTVPGSDHVTVLTQWHLLQPGGEIGETAELLEGVVEGGGE